MAENWKLAAQRGLLNCYQYAAYTGTFLSSQRYMELELQASQFNRGTHPDNSKWENERRRIHAHLWDAIRLVELCAESFMFSGRRPILRSLAATMTTVSDYLASWRE